MFPRWSGVFEFAPGHFYSPLIDLDSLENQKDRFDDSGLKWWGGIDLRSDAQFALMSRILTEVPVDIVPDPSPLARYYSNNVYFYFLDAFFAEGMLRRLRPRRVVEIGSGFSSALMLDACERAELRTRFTFIEPNPDRLLSLLRPADWARCKLIKRPIQDVSIDEFLELGEGDILFVDSSHVLKAGSDLVDILFRILPALEAGVVIHFHDIFFPEAYPIEWLKNGRSWNESLVVRALLQNESLYQVTLFSAFVVRLYATVLQKWREDFSQGYPASLWLTKKRQNDGARAEES
jgi:hypothetical protein